MAPHDRKRLRPWLENQLRLGLLGGLQWINKEEKVFKISWPRYDKSTCDMDHAEDFAVFQSWATYTGHYNEATDEPDPKTWKANLRCALHKSTDFKEIPDRHCRSGPDPYRVYKIVGQGFTNREEMPKPLPATDEQRYSVDDLGKPKEGPELAMLSVCNLNSEQASSSNHNLSLNLIEDITQSENGQEVATSATAITSGNEEAYGEGLHDDALQSPDTPLRADAHNKYPEMYLIVKYLNETVLSRLTSCPSGCRISHGRYGRVSQNFGYLSDTDHARMFGSGDVEDVTLPSFFVPLAYMDGNSLSRAQLQEEGHKLVKKTMRGLELVSVNGDIYAKRYCLCGVMCDSEQNLSAPLKLSRETLDPKKIFDHDKFCTHLDVFKKGQGPKPHPFVYLGFGQNQFARNMYIYAAVASKVSIDLLQEADPSTPINMVDIAENLNVSPLVSKTNEFDKYAADVNELVEKIDTFDIGNASF